ncbi:LysR family transcriptional regulator [Salmonella enterica]|nr:LysR family transcriptional regulator [Salmonella enterica]EBR0641809.1 LysR family transcriptional regulator [Salmonella enterica]
MENLTLDRLAGIIAFARVASLGSYTAASRALSISPSAVSKNVKRLEERLGIKLFNRTTRSLTLTSEGAELYEKAVRLLREAEDIEQTAFAARYEPAGLIKVTASIPVGKCLIAPHLPEFRRRYPNIDVELSLSDMMADLIKDGIDLAVRIGPVADSRLIANPLTPNIVSAYASPDYLQKRGVPGTPEALTGHELVRVRYHSTGQIMKWHFRQNDVITEVDPIASITVNSPEAVLAIILNSGGIGMLPTFLATQHVASGELVPVMPERWTVRHNITAFWAESRRRNPNVHVFSNFLKEIIPTSAPWNQSFDMNKTG